MRLWHDDLRPPPEGWVWVRTNQDAKHYLTLGVVEEISLDHDLGYHGIELPDDPDELIRVLQMRGQAEETGLDLVKWMCENNLVPGVVAIHSWNPAGAKAMANHLNSHGHNCRIAPFKMPA